MGKSRWECKMGRNLWPVLSGLLAAIVVATIVALASSLPFADARAGDSGHWHFVRTLLPVAAYAMPGALAALALSEARRVRGLPYFLFAGAVIAALGFIALTGYGSPKRAAFLSTPAFMWFMAMGLAAGTVYWMLAGRYAGRLAADLASASDGSHDDALSYRRCRSCAALGLLLGLVPLALLGWYALYQKSPRWAPVIAAHTEADAARWLTTAGMPWAKLRIDNHVGHVTGSAPDVFTRTAAFDKAKSVLAPMVGMPGVVAYLQNDISAPDLLGSAEMASSEKAKAEAETLRFQADAKAAAEATRQKADAAALSGLTGSARRKAEEKARAAAEDRAKQEADELARRAAEAVARLKSAEAQAETQARIAAANAADDDAKRLAAEAEAERKAVEAARKAVADEEARRTPVAEAPLAPAPVAESPPAVAPSPPPPSESQICETKFSDLFRSETIRFAFRSDEVVTESASFLDSLAALTHGCEGYALTIDGHADRTGTAAFNQAVSQSRAGAVKDALVARGIAPERLLTQGFGSERLLAPEKSRAANRLNRRIDFGYKAATPARAPAATSEISRVPFPADQCGSEFSRLFLSDAVRFDGSSAELTDDHATFIDRIAVLAVACPAFKLSLDGHTDRRGRARYNQRLSEDRAAAVRDALIDRDIAADRLVARGFGGERPYDPGNTPQAYALNRRVDFGYAETRSKSP